MSNAEKELAELKEAVASFLDKADQNIGSLWIPNLEYTEDCILLNPAGYNTDPEDDDTYEEFEGIEPELKKLAKLIGRDEANLFPRG